MDIMLTDSIMDILLISTTFSFIMMALIQKFKKLSIIKENEHIWLLNFFLSFLIGISFGLHFYNLSLTDSLWMCLFSFIGAPNIYEILKNQNIINYTPKSLNSSVTIKKEFIINRTDQNS